MLPEESPSAREVPRSARRQVALSERTYSSQLPCRRSKLIRMIVKFVTHSIIVSSSPPRRLLGGCGDHASSSVAGWHEGKLRFGEYLVFLHAQDHGGNAFPVFSKSRYLSDRRIGSFNP